MADFSFDMVSKVDEQELKNAVDQTIKEVQQRYDLKDTKSDVILDEKKRSVIITSSDEYKLKAVVDIFQAKLVKRGISLKAISYGKMEQALGGRARQNVDIQQGIPSEKAKEINKAIRDAKFKVQTQIQGDQVRVMGKVKDDLQAVISFVKSNDFGIDLQFTNYR